MPVALPPEFNHVGHVCCLLTSKETGTRGLVMKVYEDVATFHPQEFDQQVPLAHTHPDDSVVIDDTARHHS